MINIDGSLFIQIANFLVLIWILNIVVYRPIRKILIERIARIPTEVSIASEFRYREAPLPAGGLSLFISQSGETIDTLAALRAASTCRLLAACSLW